MCVHFQISFLKCMKTPKGKPLGIGYEGWKTSHVRHGVEPRLQLLEVHRQEFFTISNSARSKDELQIFLFRYKLLIEVYAF